MYLKYLLISTKCIYLQYQNIITMTKIQDFNEVVRFCEQKKQTGDVQTIARMFGFTTDAIRMRLSRKHEETYKALYKVIEQRENLIKEYQTSN